MNFIHWAKSGGGGLLGDRAKTAPRQTDGPKADSLFFLENRWPERGTREKNGEPTGLSCAELTKMGEPTTKMALFQQVVSLDRRSGIGGRGSHTTLD